MESAVACLQLAKAVNFILQSVETNRIEEKELAKSVESLIPCLQEVELQLGERKSSKVRRKSSQYILHTPGGIILSAHVAFLSTLSSSSGPLIGLKYA
jgi:hypothetical protein